MAAAQPLPITEPSTALAIIPSTEKKNEWAEFLTEHGRVPMLTDERKPWTYSGWLLHYRILAEHYGITPPRWTYLSKTLEAGKLLAEPIPRIEFEGDVSERTAGYKHIDKVVTMLERRIGDRALTKYMEWMLFGFGIIDKLPDMPDAAHEELYRTDMLGPFLEKPADYFGTWISNQKGRWNPNAFFPTPHHVVEMMTKMTMGEGDLRDKTVCDPCLGTGRFLLHASNYSLRLYGVDIDNTVLTAAKVNACLYAPWMIRPLPETFFEKPSIT